MRPRLGFTLIELLTVIAIIAVLAAILFPVFAQAKAAAKQAVCLSNVKQMGTALQLYLGDNEDTYPITFYMSWNGPMPCILTSFQSIQPYQRSAQLVICPSDSAPLDYAVGSSYLGFPAPCPAQPDVAKMSYQPNFKLIDVGDPNYLVNPYTGATGRPVHNASEIGFPADTAVFADSTIALEGGTAAFITYQMPVQPRHGSRLNVVWADSHARRLSARPDEGMGGLPLEGLSLDRKPIRAWRIVESGPYQGRREIEGIPYRDADGAWGLR